MTGQQSSIDAVKNRLAMRAGFAFIGGIVLSIFLGADKFQWDAQTYWWAGRAWWLGQQAYDPEVLSKLAGKNILPFVYPPTILPFLGVISILPEAFFLALFPLSKVVVFYLLLRCWNEILRTDRARLLWFSLLGFQGALFIDFRAGNVSVFEALLIWIGLKAWIDERPLAFAVPIVLVGQVKILPLAFLGLFLWDKRHGWSRILLAVGVLGAANGLMIWLWPDRWRLFGHVLTLIEESGATSPCQLEFWKSLIGASAGFWLYCGFSLVVARLTWQMGNSAAKTGTEGRRRAVFLACLTYALLAPRFKDYSFLLLIPSAIGSFDLNFRSKFLEWSFLAFGLVPLTPLPKIIPGFTGYIPVAWVVFFWLFTILSERNYQKSLNSL